MGFALAAATLGCGDAADGSGGAGASSSSTGAGGTGGAGASGAAGGAGGEGGGMDPYEAAVRSTSWERLPNSPSVQGGKQDDIFFFDADHGFAASGPLASVYETKDGGATWDAVFTNQGTYFRALTFIDEMHGFAGNIGAGLAGAIDDPTLIYETKDGGVTWSPVTTVTGSDAKGICNFAPIDAMNIVAVGRANAPAHMLQTSDGGANWVAKDLSEWFSMAIDARFVSPTEGIIAGMDPDMEHCTIMRTVDGGETFENVFTSVTDSSLCWQLDFSSDLIGFAAIQDMASGPGTFAKTTDGGETWVELPLPLIDDKPNKGYPAIGIGFITDQIGWVVSHDEDLPSFRTFDGGMTWEIDPELEAPINRFRFVDEHTAYAIGGSVWKLEIPAVSE